MAIEFRNNGVSDSLTNSISPTIFYSMLEREIALKLRKEVQLSIVTVEIPGANNDRQMFIANSGLKLCLRKGDFYSRIAVRGFWVCLRGNLKAAELAGARYMEKIAEVSREDRRHYGPESEGGVRRITARIKVFEHELDESLLEFLDRIDRQYFK